MNNPNPFVPQGSLLEQQSKRRSRLKLGVLCVLAVGICGLAAMLIQGCKREETENNNPPTTDQNQPPVDTNVVAAPDTNQPPIEASNPPDVSQQPAPAPAPAPAPEPAPAPTENEYVVVKGDTLGKIAKANGVTVKAIEDANPGVQPTRLKVGQKLIVPAGAAPNAAPGTTDMGAANGGGETYTIKSGDTLSHIARHFGVTVKAIEEANNLTSTKIFVGKKLTIPAKPDEAAPSNAAPEAAPAPQPAPAPAPAPANPPAQQNPPANQ